MVYRFSWLAGIAAIALAFWELSFVLRSSITGTPWQLAIVIAAVLGAVITWTLLAYRANLILVAVGNIAGFIITAGLLVAPQTLWLIFPTTATSTNVRFEMGRALEIIRYGVEPVRPVPGLVLILALLFWTLGFLLVAGLLNERPFVAVITPLIIALQFVIIDRRPKGIAHTAVFLGVVTASLLAVRLDERDRGSGRLQRVNATTPPIRRPSAAITALVLATILLAIGAVAAVGESVPNDGLVTWRTPAGYSDGYSGSASYNPFVDIKASLINQTDLPLFTAQIDGIAPDQLRFRTVTLDVFRNGRWQTNRVQVYPPDEEPWILESQIYRGETVDVTATITIENLTQPWMPAPTTSNFVATANDDDLKTVRVRRLDGSLFLPGDVTYQGMEYTIVAEVALYDGATLASLARAEDGTLSPLFLAASQDGQSIPEATTNLEPSELKNEDFWTEYPDDLGVEVTRLAEDLTANLETNYEKAIALEQYFRFSGEFTYNDRVPDEFVTSSVEDWLTDESNPYVRNGYCEQYATAMALMARTLGIPSRVVLGFTPGEPLNDNTVLVMDKNAHSWVEIWIPRFGWMMFDPTPRAGYAARTVNQTLTEFLGFSPVSYIEDVPERDLIDTDDDANIGPDGGRFTPAERPDRFAAAGGGSDDQQIAGLSIPSWLLRVGIVAAVIAVFVNLAPFTKWLRARRRRRRLARGDIAAAWEDITERLADLGDPLDPAATPMQAAQHVDGAFVPLARTYGEALYGDYVASTAVIDRATDEYHRAQQHLLARYSTLERVVAVYRPTRTITRWQRISGRRNGAK